MKTSKVNLFDLLGRPAAQAPSDGTYITCTPETLDDDGLLPSIADVGTYNTRSGGETYDDDAVLPLL